MKKPIKHLTTKYGGSRNDRTRVSNSKTWRKRVKLTQAPMTTDVPKDYGTVKCNLRKDAHVPDRVTMLPCDMDAGTYLRSLLVTHK